MRPGNGAVKLGKTRLGENYNWTIYACFIAYVIQAIAGNFAPLLFLTFRKTYGIPIEKISLLITLVFGVQLLVDFLSAVFVSKIGYRTAMIAADCLTAVGFVLLGVLPLRVDPFAGLVTASVVFALGSGLMEVLVSPIVEACPTTRKSAAMSLLHSFYSWGVAGVILLSTAFFALFGIRNWPVLACLWGVVPAVDLLLFLVVPIRSVEETGEKAPARRLFRSGKFWIMMLLMLCAGACEQSVSQWASAFAEAGLGVTKAVGDLAGPCAFALLMGVSRVFYAKNSERISLLPFMTLSGVLCLVSYLMASLATAPVVGLLGCALCGLSVGVLWPGTFSLSAADLKGGTAMFALLALAGDLGCGGGPAYVGMVAGRFGGNLKKGLLAATVFPVLLLAALALCSRRGKVREKA